MSEIPKDLRYTKEHEWARKSGDLIEVGITRYAVSQLGDVTLVDLPAVGRLLDARGPFGDIESVKTVSELYAPVAGEVVEVNDKLKDQPELVNESPYETGWMIRIKPSALAEFDKLLDATAYETYVGELEH
ncbi:MAG: glycine cleavage system protein [Pseudomonadota bacterium]|jgi:glycine cleavage system H protein